MIYEVSEIMSELEKASSGLLHVQIADLLRDKIYSKAWAPNKRIPSENRLCVEFGVSRGTARKAIKTLVDEGLVKQIHGKGTFVSGSTLSRAADDRPLSFYESLKQQGMPFVTKVIQSDRTSAYEEVAKQLKIAIDDPVLRLVRVRSIDGKPIMLLESWIPLAVCPDIDLLPLEKMSLFDAVEQTSGRRIHKSVMAYSARIAGRERGHLLKVSEGAPILNLEQLISLEDGTPIEWADTSLCAGQTIEGIGIQQRKTRGEEI